MPYSDIPPPLILPDTPEGRAEAATHEFNVTLCNRFIKDESPIQSALTYGLKTVCKNREPYGDAEHNWCRRCLAGFPVWFSDTEEHDASRIRV